MSWLQQVCLTVALVAAPLDARAADLVIWWNKGFNSEEDAAVREIIAAFEQTSGKRVALTQPAEDELPGQVAAALETGQPPDFAFSVLLQYYIGQWAFEDRLVDLSDAVGHFSDLFDPEALNSQLLLNAKTGQKALYALPLARSTNHIHVWKSLLQEAGFSLAGIPREWEAFWSFWCDRVQPAVRRATGRGDVWGVALPMSAGATDTYIGFYLFVSAYEADYVTPDGQLVLDSPEIRQRLVKAIDSYTAIYRKGCTPPDSLTWGDFDNNKTFLSQNVVMTANQTLSIPTRSSASIPTTTPTTPRRSNGHLGHMAGHFRSMARSTRVSSSTMADTSRLPRSSCASWSAGAG
jgi:multiple sugar transport system substrate-binding protein